ncbi:hypothetical protein B0H11DRAFT_448864 [Mycena galericulata]|nr:hypothetical protein B0H11DRAFT_448864 [Mycena galericulata]
MAVPNTSLNFVMDFCLSKLYTNSLISTLNARSWREETSHNGHTPNVLFERTPVKASSFNLVPRRSVRRLHCTPLSPLIVTERMLPAIFLITTGRVTRGGSRVRVTAGTGTGRLCPTRLDPYDPWPTRAFCRSRRCTRLVVQKWLFLVCPGLCIGSSDLSLR